MPRYQVGHELTSWVDVQTGIRRATTAPVPGSFGRWFPETTLGFLLTAPPHDGTASVKLVECTWGEGEGKRHSVVTYGGCGEAKIAGQIGWIFQSQQPGTVPLYRCVVESNASHFLSSDAGCSVAGRKDYLLGFIPFW